MSFTIILLASFFCLIVWLMSASSKRAKALRELADRRQRYVESISPNARIIVNNGIHLFFKDDVQQFFGFDESGNTYDFAGLFNISTYKYGIRFYHKDSMDILIGKDYGRPSITYPLPTSQIDAIAREMIPVLRNNLYAELEKEGVTPTHEYEHDGCIWGCDMSYPSAEYVCRFPISSNPERAHYSMQRRRRAEQRSMGCGQRCSVTADFSTRSFQGYL